MTARPEGSPALPISRSWSLGFSTLGSPRRTFPEVCQLAWEQGMDFVELRSLGGTIDLPAYFKNGIPPLSTGVEIRVVATSLCLSRSGEKEREDFHRFADLARKLHAPYLRVFGRGGDSNTPPTAQELRAAVACARQIRKDMAERDCPGELLLETHDTFSSSAACVALNTALDEPVFILWDAHHTWSMAGESPAATWRQLGPFIRHVHFKDSIPIAAGASAVRYVLPGEGVYPVALLKKLLADVGYSAGISLEWEKLWHQELPRLEKALPRFHELWNNV